MGVPKFFRWCAERYPSVITPFKNAPPAIDNLYLDMNGIIHNCTHPNDVDVTRRGPTEKEMVQSIFNYLERLFNAVQPRQHFFLAVDGVAPRAKMNQQRQRRYRAGYEMMVAREEALQRGEDVPEEADIFDSNCITPGTPFMVRVSKELQYFIVMKTATDPAWQSCKIIFSGHDCPGEGEHKIVDFIRRRKSQPGYCPNETHCMYGLDADLVMLALTTHEPHFVLLREVVTFGPSSRGERERQEEDAAKGLVVSKAFQNADEFVLLHINVLRDYLQLNVRDRLESQHGTSTFDLEALVDDFVFMCIFIGNDFLPTLPTVSINDGSMITMMEIYIDHILSKGMHLSDKGVINWRAAELWLSRLGAIEFETIRMRQQQEAEYQRNARRRTGNEVQSTAAQPVESIAEFKTRFYRDKHGFTSGWNPQGPDMQALLQHYVEGLQWVSGYYYQGVPSWQWFYPHYYAPMASDLVNLPAIAAKVRLELGEPFLPHQQLLAALPPMSYRSIPRAYWSLLRSKSSPLAKYFPDHIQIDREGARAPWEGIVLIPFIDEQALLAAYKSVQSQVTPEDAANNRLGPSILFTYDDTLKPYSLPDAMFETLHNVKVRQEPYHFPAMQRFNPVLCPGVYIGDRQLEGFASLHTKWSLLTPSYAVGAVSIFGMPTRRESLILNLAKGTSPATVDAAATWLNAEVFVGYPHYIRARVAAFSDAHHTLRAVYADDGTFSGSKKSAKNRDEMLGFQKDVETHRAFMLSKLGIQVDEIQLLVYVHLFAEMRLSRRGNRILRHYASAETCYPVQLMSFPEEMRMQPDTRYVERDRVASDAALGTKCVYIGPEVKNAKTSSELYGSSGAVLSQEGGRNGATFTVALRVLLQPQTIPPSLTAFAARSNWVALHEVAAAVGISPRTLGTICTTMLVSPQFGSREIGLCIKLNGRNLARVGFTKLVQRQLNPWYVGNADLFSRMEAEATALGHHLATAKSTSPARGGSGGTWYFTQRAVAVVREYATRFAPLIEYLEAGGADTAHLEPPLFMTGAWQDAEVDEVLQSIEDFITSSGVHEAPMMQATDDLYPQAELLALEDALDANATRPTKEIVLRQVRSNYLYFPITRSAGGHLVPLPLPKNQLFRLGARVVNCRATGSVPLGAMGTVVRLLSSGREAEVVYDTPFAGGTRLDGRLREPRGAITRLGALLVLPSAGGAASSPQDAVQQLASAVGLAETPAEADSGSPVNLIPKPRSALEGGASATPAAAAAAAAAHSKPSSPSSAAVSLAAKGAAGIDVRELLTKFPRGSPPSVPPSAPAPPAAPAEPAPPAQSTSAAAAPAHAGVAIPAPKSVQQQRTSTPPVAKCVGTSPSTAAAATAGPADKAAADSERRRTMVIPGSFTSGELHVSYRDSGSMFSKLVTVQTTKLLATLQKKDAES